MGTVTIRWCHTYSVKEGRLIEISWFEALKHRLKGHWVRKGEVFEL